VYASRQQNSFVAVNINTGATTVTAISAWSMKAKLHPSGKAIYTAIPYDVVKYDISSGPAVYLYHSDIYPGRNYPVGDDLWMIEDGTGLIAQYGNIFPASEGSTFDIVPPKKYLGVQFQYAADSATAAQMAAIPADSDTEVLIYDDQSFIFQKFLALPYFTSNGSNYPGHGQFVFFDSTGTRLYVIMQAGAASGLIWDFGVIAYD